MKDFEKPNSAELVSRLEHPEGRVSMVLDTDTYNEIDDQYALVYSLFSGEKLDMEAVYAAPFHNKRSEGPADGMEKSYEEILRVLERIDADAEGFVYRGSERYLPGNDNPVESEAARDLVNRAHQEREGALYVVAIGAITNVASAFLMDPSIISEIVVVWLGGNPPHYHTAREFNLMQDMEASKLIFDCGVPLVHVPCLTVAEMLRTTRAEMEMYVKGKGAIGDYIYDIYCGYVPDEPGRSKVIWDIAPVAWLLNPLHVMTSLIPSPVLNSEMTWSADSRRHLIRCATSVNRDAVFADFFRKISEYSNLTSRKF